jgi:8-oxo-dGTP pyrophosphatase MutT (NUDIX family)
MINMDKVKIVCRALITDDQGRILFVKKANYDFWSLPGGKLESEDASIQACLVREIKEELGVEAIVHDIHFVQELHKDATRYVEFIWKATITEDPVKVQGDIYKTTDGELADIRWIKKDELQANDVKPTFLRELSSETLPLYHLTGTNNLLPVR